MKEPSASADEKMAHILPAKLEFEAGKLLHRRYFPQDSLCL
jgi:hypothetical protein